MKKFYAFHNDTTYILQQNVVNWSGDSIPDQKGRYEWIIPSEKTEKKKKDRKASSKRRTEGKNRCDGEVPVIHGVFASGEDNMVARKQHIKKAKVISIEVNNRKVPKLLFGIPYIVFT